MNRIIVCGGRHFADRDQVMRVLGAYTSDPPPTLVHGACTGADTLADQVARELGWPVEEHIPEWDRYGPGAGPIRNAEMARAGADVCIAFPGGHGTDSMTGWAHRYGIPVHRVEENE
jgi:hypothetical protein